MTMRKVIYSMGVSLDGFIEDRNRSIDWSEPDPELHRLANDQAREAGAFLYGRRLYELMEGYWPTADRQPGLRDYELEFARIWTETPKVVFSTTIERVGPNARLVRDGAADEVRRLKAEPGGDLDLGGAGLAATLMPLGLIDEYRLWVNPIVLGGGTPFFPALEDRIGVALVETRTFDSGQVYLRYEATG
jgi:dihydrofolate reductase